jgi:hypothetical protein
VPVGSIRRYFDAEDETVVASVEQRSCRNEPNSCQIQRLRHEIHT